MPAPRVSRRGASSSATSKRPVRRQPQRTCIVCRDTSDKRALTRLVRSPDGRVQLDTTGRASGRGAYLCTRRECWERALGRADILGRALKVAVPTEDRDALLAEAPAHSTDDERDEREGSRP